MRHFEEKVKKMLFLLCFSINSIIFVNRSFPRICVIFGLTLFHHQISHEKLTNERTNERKKDEHKIENYIDDDDDDRQTVHKNHRIDGKYINKKNMPNDRTKRNERNE